MRLTYQYRLRPTKQQIATFENWLELCRRQYNYRLAERFNWWEQNRCDIDRPSVEGTGNGQQATVKIFDEMRKLLPVRSLDQLGGQKPRPKGAIVLGGV